MEAVDRVCLSALNSCRPRRFRRRFTANNFFSREDVLVKRLTGYIVNEYKGDMSSVQKRRLKDLVYKRIAGLIKRDEFMNDLKISLRQGGIGLNRLTAKKLTFYFEKLLIQGTESKGHGH